MGNAEKGYRSRKKLIAHDADFAMYAFYAVRGYSLETLANLSYYEKIFLHCARENYYQEETEKYQALFG